MAKRKTLVRDNPPTLQEVVIYIVENDLAVDPEDWYGWYSDNEWRDKYGVDVLSWKGKLRTSHRFNCLGGYFGPCSHLGYGPGQCRRVGVRVIGKDREGHKIWRCVLSRNTGLAKTTPPPPKAREEKPKEPTVFETTTKAQRKEIWQAARARARTE